MPELREDRTEEYLAWRYTVAMSERRRRSALRRSKTVAPVGIQLTDNDIAILWHVFRID